MKNIAGVDRWRRQLERLPEAYRVEIDKTLEKSGQDMARAARALVPVDSGKLRGSIKVELEGARDGLGRAVKVSAGDDAAFYAIMVEHGTKEAPGHVATAPRPYFWPAFRLMRRLLKGRIKAASRRAIKKIRGG